MSDQSQRVIPRQVKGLAQPPLIVWPAVGNSSMRQWSPQQEAIFADFKQGQGHTVVRARAGTGKTTTILEGLNHAGQSRILLAAFNKLIAEELKARMRNAAAQAQTLHSLGFGYVRKHWQGVSVDDKRGWDLAVQAIGSDRHRAVTTLVKNLHTKLREIMPHETDLLHIQQAAVAWDCLPEPEDESKFPLERICELALRARELAMEESDSIDFADMIFLPLVKRWVRPSYEMVVVDEAQDMTMAQLELATQSCHATGRIVVVGDDRQAIYGFRGADSNSLDRLKRELQARELGLTTTYRCGKLIVKVANQWVPDFAVGETMHEGQVLVVPMEECIKNASVGDFVLSRLNAPLVPLCIALLKRGVRARIRGRDIGKAILNMVKKWEVDTLEEAGEKLEQWAKRESMRASRLPEESRGARFRFINEQRELIEQLMDGVETMNAFKDRIELLFGEEQGEAVVMCSTVHKAKGLEADRVWMLKSTFKSRSLEEENLQYVAVTRAKQQLCWVEGGD